MRKKSIFAIFIIALNIIGTYIPALALASPTDWAVPWPNTVRARIGRLNPNTDTSDNIHNHGTKNNSGIAIDGLMASGTPIYAVADGYVVCSNHALNVASDISCERGHGAKYGNGAYGLHVIVKCDNEEIIFAHLSAVYVSKDQPVKKGQLIGLSGDTGNSSEPHLHFEIVGKYGQISSLFGKPLSWFVQGAILSGGFNLGGTQPNPNPNPNPQPNPDPGQGNDQFSFHENNSGGGRTEGFSSVPLVINDLQASNWKTLTSLTIHKSGITVKVWRGKDFSGESVTFSSQQTHNLPVEYEKKAGSLKAYQGSEPGTNPSNPTPPINNPAPQPSGLVGFFDAEAGHTNDKWNYYRTNVGNAKTSDMLGFKNDELSCVEIFNNDIVVELFSDSEYSGQSVRLEGRNKFDLRNYEGNFSNKTSSYKVYFKSQGPVSDTPDTPPVQDNPTPTPEPQPSVSYEVTGINKVSGTVIISVTSSSGQVTSIPCARGTDSCYLVKFPDHTRVTIRPEWNIEALDADPKVASGEGGELINQGATIRFKTGQTVTWGRHYSGSTVSCSFWIAQDSPTTTPEPQDPITPPQQPSPDPDPDTGDDDDDRDGGTTIQVPPEIDIGGAGCNGFGTYALIFLLPLLFKKQK